MVMNLRPKNDRVRHVSLNSTAQYESLSNVFEVYSQ